jgi:hypothetical protein
MHNWLRSAAWSFAALAAGVMCGIVGGAIATWSKPQFTFDVANVIGPPVAAAVAGWLALRYGLREYFERRQREVLMNRYVTDGLDALATAIVSDCGNAISYRSAVHYLLDLSAQDLAVDDPAFMALQARLRAPTTLMPLGHFRMGLLFSNLELFASLTTASQDLRSALEFFSVSLPMSLANVRTHPVSKREKVLVGFRAQVGAYDRRVAAILARLPITLVALANALETRLLDRRPLPADITQDPQVAAAMSTAVESLEKLRNDLSGIKIPGLLDHLGPGAAP